DDVPDGASSPSRDERRRTATYDGKRHGARHVRGPGGRMQVDPPRRVVLEVPAVRDRAARPHPQQSPVMPVHIVRIGAVIGSIQAPEPRWGVQTGPDESTYRRDPDRRRGPPPPGHEPRTEDRRPRVARGIPHPQERIHGGATPPNAQEGEDG